MRTTTIAEKCDFAGDVAAVTGGAQGIGRSIVEAFAASDADVAIADIQQETAASTAEEIEAEYGVDAVAVECDVSSADDAKAMVETVVSNLGKIDYLVNNAGVAAGTPSFLESEPEDWDTAVDVCFYGTMNCTHAVLPHMIERGDGAIVNFASDSYKGNDPGLAVYGAAKAANVSFTGTVSKEVGDEGIRINCISPGTTRTPATEDWIDEYEEKILESYALDRLGRPEDIADGVTFLCSDAADWITGQTLSVNGGYVRS
ncbi:SDR family NAD(P)-dependent oxidoreductase [Natrinema halophilum]|uniref:SDR family NAD(P)-dependent oxidoreductase n=1 Tax=Natrinema halophilum TaxID=1699371 RepID=UPI001F473560|nr:glucose 1-dehydrogenase [Natrinema halophilum]UHQ96127.1 glucose 1-dehydrogenase [Natrinema halophilum]